MDTSSIDEKNLVRKADILIADGNYEEAIVCLDKILERSSDDEEALSMKGRAYCLNGDTKRGIAILEEALAIDPFSKTVLIIFADACLHSSMLERSLELLERGISYYPDDDGFAILKATVMSAVNRNAVDSSFN